ncbi:hypothetical protein HNO53_13060 [Billgrantia antri]|uniref:Uncharacterized protein n=1 Tax=Halomonas sulfidivorans TaxID=2733488 RepID=A0ABX7WI27_9GAMM|nr:hypothetical protein [Halomonas sulfidivorans]QTP59565.1 hypothetical protein HNO53_13060 [Halomonas sulfidivorans]
MINATKETATKKDVINCMLKSGAKLDPNGGFYRTWPNSADFMGQKMIFTEALKIGLIQVMADDSVWLYNQQKYNYSKYASTQAKVYEDFDKLATDIKNNLIK